jgi:hypothetical protein
MEMAYDEYGSYISRKYSNDDVREAIVEHFISIFPKRLIARDLYTELTSKGVFINGENPISNLSAIIKPMWKIDRDNIGRYGLSVYCQRYLGLVRRPNESVEAFNARQNK